MKLLLVNDTGHPVACLEDLERYDTRSPGDVFALLNFLEELIATAKGNEGARGSEASSLATGPATR